MRLMRLAVAPLSGRYSAETIVSFYEEVSKSPHVHRAYIGELFCPKRLVPLHAFEEAVSRLEEAGKEAVFSTLALPTREVDYEAAAPYVERVTTVEVNDLGFMSWLADSFADKTLIAGPFLRLYNRDDAEIAHAWGFSGMALRIDLMPETVLDLCAHGALSAEVFLHGRPPIAHSWRCYSARFAQRPQNACGVVCRQQDGLRLDNLEGDPAFVIDGPSVLPARVISAVDEALRYQEAGAAFGRLWVGPAQVDPVSSAYAALLSGERAAEDVKLALEATDPAPFSYAPIARRRLP